jgi:4-amino-4-deoxy-L-arabinose transferase-like glycosyltransferase
MLSLVAAGLFLPNLGTPSLWDIDEGNNAEAAREMQECDNWVVPLFNYQLRVDKPALLYWLQIQAYQWFGVNEFAARLPSALAALAAVLITYELGRRMFDAASALLAGLVLASAPAFCAAAHFANPDALLSACTVLTFFVFWRGWCRPGGNWFVPLGVTTALGVLAKGPVGLLLPATTILCFLVSTRQLRRLLDQRLLWGLLAFVLVMGPWYAWVAADTRGQFLIGFFGKHNVGRFLQPMEGHHGPWLYYMGTLLVGLAPWSAFLGLIVWSTAKKHNITPRESEQESRDALRLLGCWIVVYLLFFSAASTKLPNYILPIYPPVALLTSRCLVQWLCGILQPPRWLTHLSVTCFGLGGVATLIGLLVAGGLLGGERWLRGRHLPGLEAWAAVGLLPVVGAALAWWYLRRDRRGPVLVALTASAVLFVGLLAAGPVAAVDQYKAPRDLAAAIHQQETDPEIRVACYRYFQPSLVFYCRREVQQFDLDADVVEYLRNPLPVYLVVPAAVWDELKPQVRGAPRLLARHHDLYRDCDVVLVTNR